MRRLFLDNIGWKLLSLGIAVLLWFITVGAPEYFIGTLPVAIRRLLGE